MFTSEFDRLDNMLNVAKITHDMRYGKSEHDKSNRLFYILDIANKMEVRLLDNEREHSTEKGGLDLQIYDNPDSHVKRNLTANAAMGEIMKYMYFVGEKDDDR